MTKITLVLPYVSSNNLTELRNKYTNYDIHSFVRISKKLTYTLSIQLKMRMIQ